MAKILNPINTENGYNIAAKAPIDSRTRVDKETDLIEAWPSNASAYDGMIVITLDTGNVWKLKKAQYYYRFANAPATTPDEEGEGWAKVGYLAVASKDELGGVKLGYQEYSISGGTINNINGVLSGRTLILDDTYNVSKNTIEIETRKYPLELDEENRAFVNVPWSDTKYTAGENIKISEDNVISAEAKAYSAATKETLGLIKLNSDLKGGNPNNITNIENRTYAIQLNNNNEAVVNVPWSDTKYNITVEDDMAIFGT